MSAGLARVFDVDTLRIVVNTGDDFDHWGLRICPDLDTVMYTLSGLVNEHTGWGVRDDSTQLMDQVAAQGGADWFQLGDRDLVTHLARTSLLEQGKTLSEVTRQLFSNLNIPTIVAPVTDDDHRTLLETDEGLLEFQDYFVKRRCAPRLHQIRFSGGDCAPAPSPLLADLMARDDVEGVVICPSNPLLSVLPILQVKGVRQWLEQRSFPVVAVSPFLGGAALKGPAGKIFAELGLPASVTGLDAWYGSLVDGWLVDSQDRATDVPDRAHVKFDDIMLDTPSRREHLGRSIRDWLRELGAGRP